jgi:prepilin-type N-terminal cleavage/methylation domain-containing protein
MTTSTPPPDPRRRARRAFTLVEVMISATISGFVLAGVLSSFLMLGRSGAMLVNYTTMDTQARRALEDFAQDVRMATNVTWNSATSITLTVSDNYTSTSNKVTYAWDNTEGSATYHYFYRWPGTDATPAETRPAKTTYIANVTTFAFARYDRLNNDATTDPSTKRIQIGMTITTTAKTVVNATDSLVSASFILRNKVAS